MLDFWLSFMVVIVVIVVVFSLNVVNALEEFATPNRRPHAPDACYADGFNRFEVTVACSILSSSSFQETRIAA